MSRYLGNSLHERWRMDSGQWSFLLDTAKDYGWMPKGTVCSTLDDPETWTGEYIGVPLVYMDWDDVDGMVKALRSAASKAGEEVAAAVGDEARKIGLGLVLIRRFIDFAEYQELTIDDT